MKHLVIETTKTEKEVTVNENGISDAVEKVYDATVVVESYLNGRLYATGSGFVYKTDDDYGYILTNDHVISGATDVKVLFSNDKREEVKVLGSDSYSDVALLRVNKESVVATAEIGSTEELKVGDTAFAVGAPLDSQAYAWSVTRGIISGKNRTVEVSATNSRSSQVMEVLQTDAAINSGNSGGPLCNSNGEVIGITNMKLASSSIEGMGFAIPIETAVSNAEKFIEGGQVTYPYLGVALLDATDEEGGAIVQEVEKKSPADKGGLKQGDIIIKIDDKEVTSSSYLKYNLYKHKVGDKIKLTVKRDGETKVLEITLGSNGEKA
jgi:serine protease Do